MDDLFSDPGDLGFLDDSNNEIDWDSLDLINDFYFPAPGEEMED